MTQYIKKLNDLATTSILRFCENDPAAHFFQIANIDKLKEMQTLVSYYGQFNSDHKLVGVLMSFHKLWYFSFKSEADTAYALNFVQGQDQELLIINDPFGFYRTAMLAADHEEFLVVEGALYELNCLREQTHDKLTSRAHLQDIDDLETFYQNAPGDVRRGRESLLRSLDGGRRTYIAKDRGKICAAALTTGETTDAVMIGGIHFNGNQHYLRAVLAELSRAIIKESKVAYIVIRDPVIQHICEDIGYVRGKPWNMIHICKKR